jgi:hypothetical protein
MVDEFVRYKILKSPGTILTQNEVYKKYLKFCSELNEKAESKIWFGRKMNIFGYPSKQIASNERIYVGFMVIE